MKNTTAICEALLTGLFVYAAVSKLADFDTFRGQLANQTFPHALAAILVYALPAAELLTAGLLLAQRTSLAGLWLSLGLLLAFTGYIALVKLHYWSRVPCSCGGILSHMGWTTHLLFNLFFILLTVLALGQKGKAENPRTGRHHFFT
jgi:putative oxidoreductase